MNASRTPLKPTTKDTKDSEVSKPWYSSLTIVSGVVLFLAAATETALPLWYPPITKQEAIGVTLKTLPLLASLVGVVYGRYRAQTRVTL